MLKICKFIKAMYPPYDAQSRSRTRHPLSLQSRSRGSRSQCSTCLRCQCSRNSIQNPGWLKWRRIRNREKLASPQNQSFRWHDGAIFRAKDGWKSEKWTVLVIMSTIFIDSESHLAECLQIFKLEANMEEGEQREVRGREIVRILVFC